MSFFGFRRRPRRARHSLPPAIIGGEIEQVICHADTEFIGTRPNGVALKWRVIWSGVKMRHKQKWDVPESMSYRKTSHSVYDLKYHVVWITKYRKAVLRGEIAKRARELIRQTCQQLDVYILSGHLSPDHIHLLVSVPPSLAVSKLVQNLKGRSSRRLLEEYTELNRQFWGRHLWARGYFAVTTGNVTDEIIQQYLESHSDEPPTEDDNFNIGE